MTGIVLCAAYRVRLRVGYSRGINDVVTLTLGHDESQNGDAKQQATVPLPSMAHDPPLFAPIVFLFSYSIAQNKD